MKKLILVFALACFVAFGTLGVQKTMASVDNIEIVNMNLDDDPEKDKKTDGKDKKATKASSDKSKKECKTSKKCEPKKCCPSKAAKECKEGEGGDKK